MSPRTRHPTAPLIARVHGALARGGFHSGAELASRMHVSRSAVWKAVRSLRALGVVVHAVRNRGYRLAVACEPLDAALIRAALPQDARGRVRRLEVRWSLASTNAALLERSDLPVGLADILAAEYQTAGRGRRGVRGLHRPADRSVCHSAGVSRRCRATWVGLVLPSACARGAHFSSACASRSRSSGPMI